MHFVFDDKYRIFLGTHRIQRVPDTEKNGRRQTSFVQCLEVTENDDNCIHLVDADVRIDYYRGSGPGGQHRNKTDSAVRMVHEPTGTIVTATEERSQHQNRKVARERLEKALTTEVSMNYALSTAQWNWCQWRDEVILPNRKRKSMTAVYRKGI